MKETQEILLKMGFKNLNSNVWQSEWFGVFILLETATPEDLARFIYNRNRAKLPRSVEDDKCKNCIGPHCEGCKDYKPEHEVSAEDILLKVIKENSEHCNMTLSDIKEYGEQYGIITFNEALQAMREFAPLRVAKMPDRAKYLEELKAEYGGWCWSVRDRLEGFEYYEKELLKRIKNLK